MTRRRFKGKETVAMKEYESPEMEVIPFDGEALTTLTSTETPWVEE